MKEVKRNQNIWKSLVKYFLQGLLYVVPIGVTIFLIVWLVMKLDSLIFLDIPGLGLVVILIVVTIIGYLGTHVFFSYLRPFDRAMERTPLIKLIYTSMKDMMHAFVGKKKQFKTPVLVKLGNSIEMERIGFITKEDLSQIGITKEKVAVYLPFSYGINGQVVIVPKKNITPIQASSADVMKFIVSGGVTSIETQDVEPKNNSKNEQ